MRTILPLIIIILTVFGVSSCQQDNVSPIRNVRFDPKLLNPLQIAGQVAGTCNTHSYTSGNQMRDLGTIANNKLVVTFSQNLTHAQRLEALQPYGFVKGIASQSATKTDMLYTLELEDGLNCAQTQQAIVVLSEDKSIRYAGPAFSIDGAHAVGLSNEVMVKTEPGSEAILQQFADNYNATIVGPMGANSYLVQLSKNSKGNAIDFVNALKAEKGIAHAAPDFVIAP